MNPPAACPATVDFLPAHGAMAGRIAAFDWSTTPLGPLQAWPQSLRTTVALMLDSRFAMCLSWGPELTLLYNDAYAPMLGAKEPTALGRPIARIWPDVWDDILPLIEQAMSGTSTSHEDMPLTMLRHGYPEQTYWTFSYTPVRDEQGQIPGFLNITTETTQKVLAQRRLAAEAERLGRLFDQAPSFMAMLRGPEHRFELANPGYRRLVGDRDLIGRTVAEALPDAVDQGFKSLLDDVYATGRAFSATGARFVVQATPGGPSVERYLDFVYQPVTDERGVIGIFVQGVDVTARALADEALREREAELRTLNSDLEQQVVARARERSLTWQVTPDLLAVVDADGCMQTTNPAWAQMLGWRADELVGQPWWAYVDPDDHDVTRSVLDTLRAGKPVLRFENRWRTRAGGVRTLSWVATPESGRFYCSARDVTDIKAAADALARSQAQLRTLFETSYQLQAMCTPDGTLTDANRTVLDAIGEELDAIVGRPLWETPWFSTTPGMSERVRGLFNEATRGGTARAEIEVELASGRRMHDLSIRPIRDASGRIIAVVPEAIDTTERRHAEEALRQSQKLEAMGQLTGGVAHDFNNLLTPIFTALELAGDPDARPERRARMIAVAQRSAERAATLVQRLLAFARRQPLQPVDVEVGPLVAGMAELIGSSSSPRVRLVLDIADDLPPAIADPNQLEMALLNLSVNACDAMPDGGVLTLRARNARMDAGTRADGLPPGDYVVVSVADTGHGMDEATRARAVEPFFSTKGIGRGTGLGLSMAHGLASQLGGRLAIDSAPQRGTTMELWLPVGTRRAAANADSNEDDHVNTTDEHRGTALVVDDEDAVRMCTADALDDMGYRVIEAGSAEEALAALEGGLAPDVLVTDHLMPGMTGAELARTVRDRLPGTAVVIVSGYTSMAEFDPGLTILGKPFRQHELVASVEAATASLQSAVA
ncbi:PAS domain-containing protein [Luteimonas sp. S4-F44]|uniref:PAS domain-containing protein n=1 Tax=Luteimonas sp. S4-F44 TaxID=2925842 RepID=UPI001F5314CA|nr:PAS domain-containing protein [Luteimonas sp. S4-F44]UNK42731.1 PAS domain-containing protein [Luteimonas sp. S4-F44]